MTPEGLHPNREVNPVGLGEKEWLYLSKSLTNINYQEGLHESIVVQLTRIGAITSGRVDLNPEERFKVAVESISQGIEPVARHYHLHHYTIERATRDTLAAIVYLQGNFENEPLNREVNKQVVKLAEIDKELSEANRIAELPPIRNALTQLPHVKKLIDYYLKYHTVENLLKNAKVPFNHYQERSIKRYLLGKTIDESFDGLWTLAQRYTLGDWLHNIKPYTDSAVSRAAVYVLKSNYAGLPESSKMRLKGIKLALIERMNTEFKNMQFSAKEDMILFPENYDGSRQAIIETYKNFAENNYCPMSIKNYAGMVVLGLKQQERSKKIHPGQYYSDSFRNNLDWHLLKFLEFTVTHPRISARNYKLSLLIMDTEKVLKEAKQKVL